jgi:hypothetical protein
MGLRLSLIAFLVVRIELLPALLLFVGYLVLYVLEPYWRMRALTAAGVAIASRMRTMTSSLMLAFTMILIVWFAQFAILFAVFGWALNGGLARVASVLVCLQPLLLIAAGYTFYAFCQMMQRWAVRYASDHVFQPN